MKAGIIPQPSWEDNLEAVKEFSSWLRTTAVSACRSNRMVRPQPLFDKLCGKIRDMRRIETSFKPGDRIYRCLFRDGKNGKPTGEIEQEVEAYLYDFFSKIFHGKIYEAGLPSSEDELLLQLTVRAERFYFPDWFQRWGNEENNLLDRALLLLDDEAREIIEDFYFPDAHPSFTNAEIMEAGGATRAEIAETEVPAALTALAATTEFRVICQRLGLVTQPETRKP